MFALGAVLVAWLVRIALDPYLGERAPYAAFTMALALTAWFAGVAPTAVAALASAVVAAWLFVPPRGSLVPEEPSHRAALVLFLSMSLGMVVLAHAATRLRARGRESAAAAREARDAAAKGAVDESEERRLRFDRERMARIVDTSEDAIVAKDLKGIVQTWNVGAERLFGYRAEEMIGKSIEILVPPDRRDEELHILSRIARGKAVHQYETVRITKGGRSVDVSLSISPILDHRGTVVAASKIARDISDRKRTELELARQREWFRVTLTSIGDAVITVDRDRRVTFLNATAELLTGWSAEDARGRALGSVFRIVHQETRAEMTPPTEAVLRTGAIIAMANKAVLVSRDGKEWPVSDSAAPIKDAGGDIIGVVLVFRDVSAPRRAERERVAAAAERDRLMDAERAARMESERANRAKDDFVAALSHELRTPLNAVLGWTAILSRNPEPGLLAEGLGVIARNTKQQARLISDLLDVSRIVSGKLELKVGAVDVRAVVGETVELLRSEIEAKGIRLSARLEEVVSPIRGDAPRLQQVVANLLSNACKFTPPAGGITVEVRDDGDVVEIAVSDTGVGIRPEFLPQLFQRFSQAQSSFAREFGGLGLGLAIVKKITDLHGGEVCAESPGPGQGSTFRVRVPTVAAAPAPPRAGAPSPNSQNGSQSRDVRLDGISVLLVEDDADTREVVARMLRSAGAAVHAASSASRALSDLSLRRPDVIVSDIGLPGMDGLEMMRRIRAGDAELAPVPALALTAFARPEDRAMALDAGYQEHLSKPFEAEDLLWNVASLCQRATPCADRVEEAGQESFPASDPPPWWVG